MVGFGARSWEEIILSHPCPCLRCSRAAGSPRKNAASPGAGLRFMGRHQQGLPTSLGPPDTTMAMHGRQRPMQLHEED